MKEKPTRGREMDIKFGSWTGGGCLRSDQLLHFYWSTTSLGFATGHVPGSLSQVSQARAYRQNEQW